MIFNNMFLYFSCWAYLVLVAVLGLITMEVPGQLCYGRFVQTFLFSLLDSELIILSSSVWTFEAIWRWFWNLGPLLVFYQLTVASIKMGRPEIAEKAVELAERRIAIDKWPEYYDTKRARFIGKQARLYQTWSIAGYLVAKLLLANPSAAKFLTSEEDSDLRNAFSCMISANPRRTRGRKKTQQPFIVWKAHKSFFQCEPLTMSSSTVLSLPTEWYRILV